MSEYFKNKMNGGMFDSLLVFLKPRALANFATSDETNLKHVQEYMGRVKKAWRPRSSELCINAIGMDQWNEYKFDKIKQDVLDKCMLLTNNNPIYGEGMILLHVMKIEQESTCRKKIWGWVLGGNGAKYMGNANIIDLEKRKKAPKIFLQYPIWVVYKQGYEEFRTARFIPYRK